MPYAICPECDEDIYIRHMPKLGDIVYCPSCETRLEVVNLNPLELDWPWDEDEEEDLFEDEDLEDEDLEDEDLGDA